MALIDYFIDYFIDFVQTGSHDPILDMYRDFWFNIKQ